MAIPSFTPGATGSMSDILTQYNTSKQANTLCLPLLFWTEFSQLIDRFAFGSFYLVVVLPHVQTWKCTIHTQDLTPQVLHNIPIHSSKTAKPQNQDGYKQMLEVTHVLYHSDKTYQEKDQTSGIPWWRLGIPRRQIRSNHAELV